MCNECKCLSSELRKLGFFMVYGQIELSCSGIQPENYSDLSLIGKGDPKKYDYNNGVHVVYDEEGYPWICNYDRISGSSLDQLKKFFGLESGAWVPHSNDGGTYIRALMQIPLKQNKEKTTKCEKCNDTGVIETGNNDLPCTCPLGKTALFNQAGVEGLVTGEEIERHFLNNSPEPIFIKGTEKLLASELPGRKKVKNC
jgi:hypothetical protein